MKKVSIVEFVLDTIQKIQVGNFEAALVPACIAVAATSKKEYPNLNDNQRYKEFLKSNSRIIGFVAFNINCPAFHLAINHPELQKKKNPQTGAVPLEEIIYHAIRCPLIHEAEIDDSVQISREPNVIFSFDGSKLIIGQGLAAGLLVSAILSPKYAGLKGGNTAQFSIKGIDIPLHDLWGKKAWFVNKFDLN